MSDEQRAMAEVMEQDAKFQGEKTASQVKDLADKLTALNSHVHTEFLKLRELLEDKAFKKRVTKIIQPQIDELHERLDGEEGKEEVYTEIKEHVDELRVIYDELREKLFAALQVQVETNTKEITFVKGELDKVKGESGKSQEDQLKALMAEIEKLNKTVEGKAANASVEQTKKDVTQVNGEVDKLAARLAELVKELNSVKESASAAEAMKELLNKISEVQSEMGKLKETVDSKASAKAVDEIKEQYVPKTQIKPIVEDIEKAKTDLAEISAAIESLRADGGRTQAVKALESLFFKKIQDLQEEFVRTKVEVLKEATATAIKEGKKEFTPLSEFNQTKADHERAIDGLRDELESLKQAVAKKEGTQTAEAALSAISRLNQELDKMRDELTEIRSSLTKAREDTGSKAAEDELKRKVQELTGQLGKVREGMAAKADATALGETNKNVSGIASDLEKLKKSLSGLEGKVDKVDAASVHTDAIKAAGDEFGAKLQQIKSDVDALRDNVEHKAEKQTVEDMKKEFAPKPEVDRLAQELEKLKLEVINIGSSVDTVKAASGNAEAVKQAEDGFIKRIMELSAQLEQLRTAVDGKCSKEDAEKKASKEDLASVTEEIDRLKKEIAALTKSIEQLRLDALERETAIKKEIVDVATQKTAELRKEIDAVKQTAEAKASKDELAQLQEKINRLAEELRKLNSGKPSQAPASPDKATKALSAKIDKLNEELKKFYPLDAGKKLEDRVKALEDGANFEVAERGITLNDDAPKQDDQLAKDVAKMRDELAQMKEELSKKKKEPTVVAKSDDNTKELLKKMDERMTKMEEEIQEIRSLAKTPDGKPVDDSETKKLREELEALKKRMDKIPQDDEIITHSRLSSLLSPVTIIVILLLLAITVLSNLLQPEMKEIQRMKSSISDMNGMITNVSGVVDSVVDTLLNMTNTKQ